MGFFDGFKFGIKVTHLQNDSNDLINRYCDSFVITKQMMTEANDIIRLHFFDMQDMSAEEAALIKLAVFYSIAVSNDDKNMRSILTGAILKFGNISEKKISPKASFVVRELTGSTLAEDLLNHV
jgi:hypothetical protein